MKWVNIGFLWNNYDYKNHPSVDKEHKLIGAHAATDAAVHDSRMLEAVLVRDNAVSEVWADSSYRSRETEGWLKENGFFSRIHWRGKRGKPSSAHEQAVNRRRTRVRARVEHVFATQTNDMGGKFARTIGLVRATAKIDMMNPAYHRRRYVWLESRNGPPVPA